MKFKATLVIGFSLLFAGCHNQLQKQEIDVPMTRSMKPQSDSSPSVDGNSTQLFGGSTGNIQRKFIRTADVKFKVKDVVNATSQIEDLTRQMGGFVASTDLKSHTDNTTTIAVSADSSLESTYYSVSNSLVLRVPDVKLDSTLRVISGLVSFLDSRVIKADDVHLQLLANQLTQERVNHHSERLTTAIDTKGKKLAETTGAEESLTAKQTEADNAKLASLNLEDQINYSTISLQIYERPAIARELIGNNKDIRAYQPGLGTRVADAFKIGWDAFESLLVILVQLWWLILLGVTGYFLISKLPKFKTKM